jgi:hypothetical protein
MGGGSAPAPDPQIGAAALRNAELSKEALSWYKDLYANELMPLQKEQQAMGRQLMDRYFESQDKQEAFADKQNSYYESTYKPIEQQVARDAMGYDSAENIAKRSGIAGANVEQNYSAAQQENARNLSRYGLNPNSSAFALTNERLMRDKALAKAGAETGAAFDTMDRGIALRAGAANFGRNMPNTASNYYTNANNAGAGAMNTSTQMNNTALNNASVMGQGFSTAMNGNQSSGNLLLSQFGAQMQGYQADQSAKSGMYQGIGTLVGMGLTKGGAFAAMADGGKIHQGPGKVRGIGGPVDDKIPAMLSNGEYVIPADVVEAKGVEFFDRLKDKYHTAAATQRQAIKRG